MPVPPAAPQTPAVTTKHPSRHESPGGQRQAKPLLQAQLPPGDTTPSRPGVVLCHPKVTKTPPSPRGQSMRPRHLTGQSGSRRPRAGKPLTWGGWGRGATGHWQSQGRHWGPQHTQPGQVPLHRDRTEGTRGRGGLLHRPHDRRPSNGANLKLLGGSQGTGRPRSSRAAASTGSSSCPGRCGHCKPGYPLLGVVVVSGRTVATVTAPMSCGCWDSSMDWVS